MTCAAVDVSGHGRVLELLAVRAIVPESVATNSVAGDTVLEVIIADHVGLWPIQLARIFERVASVRKVELEVDGQIVDIHGSGRKR